MGFPPFINVVNNSGIIVQRGGSGFLTPNNLSVETNLNVLDEDVIFSVEEGPEFGSILIDDLPVSYFTGQDLIDESVEYRNAESASDGLTTSKDFVRFTVVAEGDQMSEEDNIAKAEGVVQFHVYPESYWEPLIVTSNNSLLVEESTSVQITEKDLQVKST